MNFYTQRKEKRLQQENSENTNAENKVITENHSDETIKRGKSLNTVMRHMGYR